MKTIINASLTKPIMVFVVFILMPVILFSQNDYIIFKSGKEVRAKILSKTSDTLTYYERGKSEVIYTVTMDKIDTIMSGYVLSSISKSLTPRQELLKKKLHYQSAKTASAVVMACGAGLVVAGLIVIPERSNFEDDEYFKFKSQKVRSKILCTAGSITLCVGATVLLTNSINLKKVEKALKGFSMDLHGDSGQPGITLSYKF
ncbi:MAG TPA: hypothetical protein PKN12_10225 [Bacteroidales bacterium]|nr:hypothetical protein [Bacteroidales bacterium]HPT10762.1 hypothetical protein [Bacteroidales bacterium]